MRTAEQNMSYRAQEKLYDAIKEIVKNRIEESGKNIEDIYVRQTVYYLESKCESQDIFIEDEDELGFAEEDDNCGIIFIGDDLYDEYGESIEYNKYGEFGELCGYSECNEYNDGGLSGLFNDSYDDSWRPEPSRPIEIKPSYSELSHARGDYVRLGDYLESLDNHDYNLEWSIDLHLEEVIESVEWWENSFPMEGEWSPEEVGHFNAYVYLTSEASAFIAKSENGQSNEDVRRTLLASAA